jgi:hypothetical protein
MFDPGPGGRHVLWRRGSRRTHRWGDIGWKGTRRGREERIGLGKEGITQSPQRNAVVWEKTASVPSDSFSFFSFGRGKNGTEPVPPSGKQIQMPFVRQSSGLWINCSVSAAGWSLWQFQRRLQGTDISPPDREHRRGLSIRIVCHPSSEKQTTRSLEGTSR